jgi:hypothetical protein
MSKLDDKLDAILADGDKYRDECGAEYAGYCSSVDDIPPLVKALREAIRQRDWYIDEHYDSDEGSVHLAICDPIILSILEGEDADN